MQTRYALALHYYSIREEATSLSIVLQLVLCQEIDIFLTLANIYTADPYFRVPLLMEFTYVSVWWQWDRKQNTRGFFRGTGERRWVACADGSGFELRHSAAVSRRRSSG
jgi:hypothetical protein